MTDPNIKRKATKDSEEKSESNTNSKDDENLMQNWSLTFTEYAMDDRYTGEPRVGSSEGTGKNSSGQLRSSRAPDGRGFHLDNGRLPVNQNDPVQIHGLFQNGRNSDEIFVSEKIEVQLPQAEQLSDDKQSVSIEGKAMSIAKSRDRNSARTGEKNSARTRERNSGHFRRSENASLRSGSAKSYSHTENKSGNVREYREHLENSPMKESTGNKQGGINRHQMLPSIGQRQNFRDIPDVVGVGRSFREKPDVVEVGRRSREKPDIVRVGRQTQGGRNIRNTPPPRQDGYGGKVQPIYVRFPGQRTGQMMFAEMNQQSGQVRIVGRDKEKEMLARLAWLLLDAGTSALRATFDSIHPPLNLREHLRQSHVKAVLQRLMQQTILTEKQWQLLYPVKKKHQSSQKYDSRTLIILLETICHLCPPYPHGWGKEPLPKDGSLSADIVRLQLLFRDIARHEAIAGEAYAPWFIQIRDVIIRLGGPPIRIKITRIETEMINLDMQQHYIKMRLMQFVITHLSSTLLQTLRETWQPDVVQKLEKVHEFRTKTSKARKAYANSKGADEGLSPEDRVTLKKTYKLLVENVQAEDVIDRLQQSQVIKFSDRQEVLSVSKKQERMQMLLDKLADSKLPYSLKALFDAMKFKYKKLYEHVMAIRKQTYKEGVVTSIDVSGIVQEALMNNYKNTFSRVYPFPWSESIHGTIRDIYTPLDIIDSNGYKLHSNELLPAPCPAGTGRGNRIMLEGASGSGKSVLCAWLSYMWATHPTYFKHKYSHLLYLNTSSMQGNFETAVYKSLFPDNFKISINEVWKMLEKRSSEVLVIIDDYDKGCNIDLTAVLSGTRLKESTVLYAVNPEFVQKNNNFTPDIKWFNLGFNEVHIRRCFRNCVSLSELEHDEFEKLYHLAGRESWPLRQHLVNPMLAVTAFGVFNVLKKGTMLREMKTTCDLLEKYGAAMATLYCRKQKIDIIGFEFPDEVLSAIEKLDRFAFICMMEDKFIFTEAEILEEIKDPIVLKFGAFSKFTHGSKLKFSCGISADFLAARHIADMVYEDMETTILKNKMVKFPRYTQMMSFLYGQYRDDTDTQVLQSLFDQLAARNEYCIRGFILPDPSISTPIDSEGKVKVPRGVLHDFSTSLQCLAECPERLDAIFTIAQTLPQRLIIRIDGMLSLKCVQGLCLCLENQGCAIQELEIEVHQYHYFQLAIFLQLAKSVGHCSNICSVKITWSSLDVMAKFIAQVMENTHTIDTVVLTEDQIRKPVNIKQISAVTWAALQSACTCMTSVERLSFLSARVTAIVNHVLQYMPTTIAHVNLTGCALNLMCAGQIASYLHGNNALRVLDLSYVKFSSTEFVAIFQGMQMCEGIHIVRVRGAKLDRPCVVALAEYIKLTHSLETLDLSDCELNTEMCTRLVTAIRQNRTLQKLVFNNTRITTEGRRVIAKTKSKVQRVFLEGLVPIYG